MTGAVRPAIEIAIFGLDRLACCPNRTRRGGDSRCKGPEDGIKMPDDFRLPANHLAVTALQAPYSSAYPDIDVMNSCVLKLSRAAYVVMIIGVATVNHDVARLQQRSQGCEQRINRRGRHHQPHGSGL